MEELDGKQIAAEMNKMRGGWGNAMAMRFVSVTDEECVVELTVGDQHLQPYGIVHGGVHAGVIESICSTGAAVAAHKRGHKGGVVGLENHTSFIRAVRAGTVLRGTAVPLTRGRTTQVWEAKVTDLEGQLIARGTVRLLCVGENQLPPAPTT